MSVRYEIIATNDVTSVHIATKYTLEGSLHFACELLPLWDDVAIREREEGSDVFKLIARLSNKGLLL